MEDDTTKVKISKVDITNDEELTGAELVILDEDGNIVDKWISGETPHTIPLLISRQNPISKSNM
jgi:hypothetical protein